VSFAVALLSSMERGNRIRAGRDPITVGREGRWRGLCRGAWHSLLVQDGASVARNQAASETGRQRLQGR